MCMWVSMDMNMGAWIICKCCKFYDGRMKRAWGRGSSKDRKREEGGDREKGKKEERERDRRYNKAKREREISKRHRERLTENHSCNQSYFPLWVCVTPCVCVCVSVPLCRCVLILKTKLRLPAPHRTEPHHPASSDCGDIHEMTSRFTNLAHPTNFSVYVS